VQKICGLAIFASLYIVVKLSLKNMPEIPFLSNYAPQGRDSDSFLWKNIGSGYMYVEFAIA